MRTNSMLNLFLTLPYEYMLGTCTFTCTVLVHLLVMDLAYAVAKDFW